MSNFELACACEITTGRLDSHQSVKGGQFPFFTCSKEPDQIDHYAFDADAILAAGNNAQGNFHISRYCGKFNAYQRPYGLTTKPKFDVDYIYYALKLELKRLKERSQGSQTKFLTKPILNSIVVRNIPEADQKRASRTLKIIDQKIALNAQINAELEAMAKLIYDYWFVQFDFPDKNGKPYKSSGGEMVWCDQLKRDIPAGWTPTTLAANIGCELATANDCVLASAMLVNRGRFDDSLGGTKSQAVSLAVRGCTLGSPSGCMDAMALYGGAHGFTKDRKLKKKYRDIGCAKAQEDGKFDTTTLMVTCAKERVRWYKETYGN